MEGNMATVLVVDDENLVRRSMVRMLAASGYKVVDADNGQAALQVLGAQQIDVVLMDVDMPGRSGLQTLQDIRGNPLLKHIPVILMSGRFDAGAMFKNMDPVPFLAKPFEREDAVVMLQSMLAPER